MDKEDTATLTKVGKLVLGGFAVMFFLIVIANLI
tara:strand:- start:153 stop:254 length:102 start_codon:yes stop_codon:yes gene_type:complete